MTWKWERGRRRKKERGERERERNGCKIFRRSFSVKQGKNKAPVTLEVMSQAPVPFMLNTVLILDERVIWWIGFNTSPILWDPWKGTEGGLLKKHCQESVLWYYCIIEHHSPCLRAVLSIKSSQKSSPHEITVGGGWGKWFEVFDLLLQRVLTLVMVVIDMTRETPPEQKAT